MNTFSVSRNVRFGLRLPRQAYRIRVVINARHPLSEEARV